MSRLAPAVRAPLDAVTLPGVNATSTHHSANVKGAASGVPGRAPDRAPVAVRGETTPHEAGFGAARVQPPDESVPSCVVHRRPYGKSVLLKDPRKN